MLPATKTESTNKLRRWASGPRFLQAPIVATTLATDMREGLCPSCCCSCCNSPLAPVYPPLALLCCHHTAKQGMVKATANIAFMPTFHLNMKLGTCRIQWDR